MTTSKEERQRRKSAGQCVRCKRSAIPGRSCCGKCLSYSRNYQRTHRKAYEATNKKWRLENPDKHRESVKWASVKRNYGITRDEWQALHDSQSGACPVCQRPLGSDAAVDHDHKTGQVRGLLHRNCNIALGMLLDNPEIVYGAYQYLSSFKVAVS